MRDLEENELVAVAGGHFTSTRNPDSTDIDAWPDDIDGEFADFVNSHSGPPSGDNSHPAFFNADPHTAVAIAQMLGLSGQYIQVPGAHKDSTTGAIIVTAPQTIYVPFSSDPTSAGIAQWTNSHAVDVVGGSTILASDTQQHGYEMVRNGVVDLIECLAGITKTWGTMAPEPIRDKVMLFSTAIEAFENTSILFDTQHVHTRDEMDHAVGEFVQLAARLGVDGLQWVLLDTAPLDPIPNAALWVTLQFAKTAGFFFLDATNGWDAAGHLVVDIVDAGLQPVTPPTSGGGDSGDQLTLNP